MKRTVLYLLFALLLIGCRNQPQMLSELKSEYVTIDDSIRVHYKLWIATPHSQGENESADSEAKTICFVHGFGCDMNTWEKQFEAFRDDKDLQLVFIDLPGYGQSDKPHVEYTLDFFAHAFDGPECRDVITGFVSSLAGKGTPQEINDYAMSVMPETPQYVASSTMQHLIEKRWWNNRQITQPVMVICTQNSGLDPDNKQKMQRLYPHLDYMELTTCGHFIHMEQPEMFNEKLKAFINRTYCYFQKPSESI